jgi:hypothetical protein
VFKFSRKQPWPPTLDLSTIRDTLSYMHGDMKRVAALDKAAKALEAAIQEIDAARDRTAAPVIGRITSSRFMPRKH